jgi:hypothetical protein
MPRMRRIVLVALLCGGACASSEPMQYPSTSVGSGYSGLASIAAPQAEATGVGMSRELEAGLVVRPDALMMEARIEKEAPTAPQALALAQTAAGELAVRLQQATAGAATFTPCGTKVTPNGRRKTAGSADAFAVTVEGRIEVALAAEADYWKRSALVAGLAELADRYSAARVAKTADAGVFLGRTRVVVKNPEASRAKLTELWVQRARAFAAAAQTHEAPLVLLDCAPPGEIAQKERSLEEIALSLSVSCRLGSLKAAAAVAPAAR